ncbi:MAG TPA: hypothetical protein VGN99_01470 [Steroidobacteraceae bacterium]|nr:hypothetical protein [Steroidobacteraceae bacterium]
MTAIAAAAPDPTIDSRHPQVRSSPARMKPGGISFAERRKSKRQGRMTDFQSLTGVRVYALISRMRVLSSPAVIERQRRSFD